MAKSDLKIRSVSAESLGLDVNTAVGLSSNGTVHPVPAVASNGDPIIVNFFTQSGEKLPRSYYELLVKNENLVLDGLSGDAKILIESRIAEIKKYLELTASKN